MKFTLKINGTESEKAAYVGWTPIKCTLTIDVFSGMSSIPAVITTGDYGTEGKLSLYESNATSSKPVDSIEYTFQGEEEFTFYIAGKYPHASVGKKDTFIQINSSSQGVEELKRNIMVRVRKNANELKPQEIEAFLNAFIRLNNKSPKNTYSGGDYTHIPKSVLDEIVLMHTYDASSEIHRRTSFHPWHRLFLSHLERELQGEDPTVTVPYWRYDKGANRVFTSQFIGETLPSNGNTLGQRFLLAPKPVFSSINPLYTYSTIWGALIRGYRNQNPLNEKPSTNIFSQKKIVSTVILVPNVYGIAGDNVSSDKFKGWAYQEEGNSHNPAHNTFDGRICDVGRDPVDPLFFMMHGNVDRLWALWQRKHNKLTTRHTDTYPFQGKYVDGANPQEALWNRAIGNYVKDTLWPWNFDHNPTRPERKWDYSNDGLDIGNVPNIDLKFPDSVITNYPGGSPTLESTIDYQGRLNGGQNLGFDYDRIPYFDHDKIDFEEEEILMENMDKHREVFLSKSRSIDERLKSADLISFLDEKLSSSLLEILQDKNEDESIRLRTIDLIDNRLEGFLDVGLKIIKDENAPANLRSELIHAVFTARRSNPHFNSKQPEFFNTLRGLVRDEVPKLRFQAIKTLVESGDETVQEFLVEEAIQDQNKFILRKDAVALLAQNPKPQHAKLFRRLFEQNGDPEVKKSAIEGLGNDPESIEFLKSVVKDETQSFKVREAGALSLHHLDHEAMNDLAAEIIAKPERGNGIRLFRSVTPDPDEVDFKAGLLNMLTFTGDLNRLKHNEDLQDTLKRVIDSTGENKANFRSSFEAFTDGPIEGPTIIEQMAAKLLSRIEEM